MDTTCENCGTSFRHDPGSVRKYCTKACDGAARQKLSEDRLLAGKLTDRGVMKRAFIRLFGYTCAVCRISDWQGKPIALQLDHIDGNAANNQLVNLRLICPNCHSQTPTFGARNKGSGRRSRGLPLY